LKGIYFFQLKLRATLFANPPFIINHLRIIEF
jgi:hypothetical protein